MQQSINFLTGKPELGIVSFFIFTDLPLATTESLPFVISALLSIALFLGKSLLLSWHFYSSCQLAQLPQEIHENGCIYPECFVGNLIL